MEPEAQNRRRKSQEPARLCKLFLGNFKGFWIELNLKDAECRKTLKSPKHNV